MCIFILLFFVQTFCFNRYEGEVILTDFSNENSPIYVMAPFYESYTVDLFNSRDILENTSFSNIQIYNNDDVTYKFDSFINRTKELMLQESKFEISSTFCPIDEWGPPYQPARLYLSKASIDLLTFNQSDGNPVQVQQQLHQDIQQLNKEFVSIDCYSIFQYTQDNQFAIDCNINQQPAFLSFQLEFDYVTQIIVNFTYQNIFYYNYVYKEEQELISKCLFRKTISINIFTLDQFTKQKYLQYCVGISTQDDNDQYIIIEDQIMITNTSYEFLGYIGNINLLSCLIDVDYQIEQIFANQLINGYDLQTWNIGFLFQESPNICKCRFQILEFNKYKIECSSTLLELYRPKQIRKISNLNDEVVLITGTNQAVLAIILERSFQSENYFTISYQQIYEPQYYLIDITITSSYLSVILTDQFDLYNTSPYLNDPKLFCSQPQTMNAKNLLKIYYLNPKQKQVFYSTNAISSFCRFFQTLSLSNFGNFLLIFDFYNSNLNMIQLLNKQLQVSYQLNQSNQINLETNYIIPSIIQFNITGIYSIFNWSNQSVIQKYINFQRQIIICFIKFEDINFYLIAKFYKFNKKNYNFNLSSCPISEDILIFQELINSIDLFDGIFGPLLNFNYIPNYNESKFYPYYQNHKAIIKKHHFIEKYLKKNFYKVLRSVNKNIYITQNIFGIVETYLTYDRESSTKSKIYNQTCVINAIENQQMQRQFPIRIEIEDCSENLYRDLSNFMSEVDYYKEFQYYDYAAQYENAIIIFCLKWKLLTIQSYCKQIKGIYNDTIQQLYISQGPQNNDVLSYFLTILYQSNLQQLQFYLLEIVLPDAILSQKKRYDITQYYLLNTQNTIIKFKYTYLSQQTLFILQQNSEIVIYTPGPINSTNEKGKLYFTSMLLNKSINVPECYESVMMGFEITNYFQSKFAKQYLIFWCQSGQNNNFKPYIFQYIINEINQITFWRQLPLYDTVLNDECEIILSGLILYVPIVKKSVYQNYFQNYYIYDLNDYTARSLVEKIEIEKSKTENIILYPIEDLLSSIVSGSSTSLTLILTSKRFEIYYLNQKAEFVFHLQQQFIQFYNQQPFVLVIAIFQPSKTLTLYRNYTIVYNFSSTQITFYENKTKHKITVNPDNLTTTGGFYQYLLLINSYYFNGPISNYLFTSNLSNLTVIPSPYLEENKYLGNYMDEVIEFGQVTQIIDIGDEIYVGLITGNLIDFSTYSDLILVLTDKFLIFYQKSSLQSDNLQKCNFTNYTQNFTNQNQPQCQIRVIHKILVNFQNEAILCQMQLNGANAVLIVCQTKYLKQPNDKTFQFQKQNNQSFSYIEFEYIQIINKINVTNKILNQKQYCYCYYNDLQPFAFNQSIYQVIKKSYQGLNTYFGIYQITIQNNSIQFTLNQSYPNQFNQIPYDFVEDFTLSVIQNNINFYLYLIMIQPNNILVEVISLQDNFPASNNGFNLKFKEQEQFVLAEKSIFIQAIYHIQPLTITDQKQTQVIIIGNNNQIYEIEFNVFTFEAQLTHTFYQYMLCHSDFLSRPQIEIQYENDTVFYLITQCLSNQFEYQSLQVEMTYLLNELNTNIVYTSLFVRNYSTNYTRPVEILQPYLVNPQDLHFQKIQIYQVFDENHTYSYSHLLITNNTYFLIDLFIFSSNGYYLYYPIDLVEKNKNHSIRFNISAYNSYSNCDVEFELVWQRSEGEVSSLTWFYFIIGFMILILLIMFVNILCARANKKKEMLQYEFESQSEHDYREVEMQRPEQNKLLLGDLLKDYMRGTTKQNDQYELIE